MSLLDAESFSVAIAMNISSGNTNISTLNTWCTTLYEEQLNEVDGPMNTKFALGDSSFLV